MNSTGPYFLTSMVKKYKEKNIKNLYILSSEEYAGDCTVCNENTCQGGTYFSHIKGQSWNSWDSLFYNFLLCNYKKIIFVTFLLVILYIFFKRNKVFKLKKYLKI
jgi:mannosyltransferase OCH1-like enzyme